MVERIVKLLDKNIGEDKYLINYEKVNSKELFFIKDKLDMNRAKSVEHCSVTLYKSIEDKGVKYLGSATIKVSPGMSDDEITDCIKTGLYGASLVKNPVYELVKPSDETIKQTKSNLSLEKGNDTLKQVIDLVYSVDKEHTASVNSMEIFMEETTKKIINSEGVDETYSSPKLIIELVVDCKGKKEEVELYDMISVSSYDEKMLSEKITADFVNVEARAKAEELSGVKDVPVVLSGEAACEMFTYYTFKSDVVAVYKKYSQFEIGDEVQGEEVKGDKISITLMPEIPFSVGSKYIDDEGIALKEVPLYADGKLLAYHGSNRYSQYYGVMPTGIMPNVKIHAGSGDIEDMKSGECLEVISFSDFQMDSVTGDFGGEIRLAIHHKDGKANPVTGGSITGNITKVHDNIILSNEMDITGRYEHPKAIKIDGTKISS